MAVKIKNSNGEWVIDQKAIQTSIADLEGNFESENVEGALRELANKIKQLNRTELTAEVRYSGLDEEEDSINILPYNFKLRDSDGNILGIDARSKVNSGVTTMVDNDENGYLTINTDGDMTAYTYVNLTYPTNPLSNVSWVYTRFKYICDTTIKFSIILQSLNFDGSVNKQVLLIDSTLEANKQYVVTKNFNLADYNLNSPTCMFRIQFKFGDANNLTQVTNFILNGLDFTLSSINEESLITSNIYTITDLYKYFAPLTLYGVTPPIGNYMKGTKVINLNPTAGGYIGWVCTSAGTWKGFGLIEN